jgi:hypothetical protein
LEYRKKKENTPAELLGRTPDTLLGRTVEEGRTEEIELSTPLLAGV